MNYILFSTKEPRGEVYHQLLSRAWRWAALDLEVILHRQRTAQPQSCVVVLRFTRIEVRLHCNGEGLGPDVDRDVIRLGHSGTMDRDGEGLIKGPSATLEGLGRVKFCLVHKKTPFLSLA